VTLNCVTVLCYSVFCFDIECQKAVTMIRTLQAQQTEELQQERQSANQVLETTKAQHHSDTEKHAAEIAALREELELTKKKAGQQAVQIEQAKLQMQPSQTQKIEQTQLQKIEQPQAQKTEVIPDHKYVSFPCNIYTVFEINFLILKGACSKGGTYSLNSILCHAETEGELLYILQLYVYHCCTNVEYCMLP